MPAKRKTTSSADKEAAVIPAKNIKPDNQHKTRMVWLPTECWVDTFKFLSRRDLLQRVQPVDKRFHAIAETKMDNVHIIRKLTRFINEQEDKCQRKNNKPEAKKQKLLEELEATTLTLAKHFRLAGGVSLILNRLRYSESVDEYLRRYPVQMCLLRNSMALFRNCNLKLNLLILGGNSKHTWISMLELFQPAQPFHIEIWCNTRCQGVKQYLRDAMSPWEMLVTPIMLNCMRLTLEDFGASSITKIDQLLEHLPTENGMQQGNPISTTTNNTRVMIVENAGPSFCSKLIERCKKKLLKAKRAEDARKYLVVFKTLMSVELRSLRLDHSITDEVLQLEQIQQGTSHRGPSYAMRRCQSGELATKEQFYSDIFTPNLAFKLPDKDGIGPLKVETF